MRSAVTFLILLTVLFVAFLTGCKKDSSSTPDSPPNTSGLSVKAPDTYQKGTKGRVRINSAVLATGDYTVHFNCAGSNVLFDQSALISINNHTGVFETPVLDNNGLNSGATYVTVIAIDNSYGSTHIQDSNIATLIDSSGLMTYSISGATNCRTVSVSASKTGSTLNINGVLYFEGSMNKNSVLLSVSGYYGIPDSFIFSSTFLGASAIYQFRSGSAVLNNNGVHGQINITTVTQLLTGHFSFTCTDSTKLEGVFSCPAP